MCGSTADFLENWYKFHSELRLEGHCVNSAGKIVGIHVVSSRLFYIVSYNIMCDPAISKLSRWSLNLQ